MRDICYNLKHDNRSEYERCVGMTANEMQSYLNHVIEVESRLTGLRASYQALIMRDQHYEAVGTRADYSLGVFGYGRNLRDERELRNAMSRIDDWLGWRGKWDLEDDEEANSKEYKPIEFFSDYAAFAQQTAYQINDSIENEDNKIKRDLFARYFQAPEVVEDTLPVIEKVQEPAEVAEVKHMSQGKRVFWTLYSLLFGAFCGFGFISVFLVSSGALDFLPGAIIGASIGSVILYFIMKYASFIPQEKKAEQYDAYLIKKKAYDEYLINKTKLDNADRFAGTKAKFQTAFDHAAEIASGLYEKFALKRNQMIRDEIPKLEKQIQESEEVLDKLYAMNVLHPKYRNLTAASIILEYLETGRCSELTGHEGAYNLYESELRQNLIIAKLDVVIQKLDELKATMYRCCTAIENVGKQVKDLEKELKTLNATAAKQLAVQTETLKLTALNATYSAAIAANTEAIKYLTLVQ